MMMTDAVEKEDAIHMLVYRVDEVCSQIFPRWRAFCLGNPTTAIKFATVLREASKIGVYGEKSNMFVLLPMFAETLLESSEFMVAYLADTFPNPREPASTIDINATFGSTKCGTYIENLLAEITHVTKQEMGMPRDVHPTVVPCIAPLIARRGTDTESMAYDFDGIRVLADKVLLSFDVAREKASKKMEEEHDTFYAMSIADEHDYLKGLIKTMPCYRAARAAFTCSPFDIVSRDSINALFVPECRMATFTQWLESRRADDKLSRSVDSYLRQAHQPGWSVANIISSGSRGGFIADRRKKKMKIESAAVTKNADEQPGARKRSSSSFVFFSKPSSKPSDAPSPKNDDVDGLLDVADELAIDDPKTRSALAACRAENEDAEAVAAAATAAANAPTDVDPMSLVSAIAPRMWGITESEINLKDDDDGVVEKPERKRRRRLLRDFGLDAIVGAEPDAIIIPSDQHLVGQRAKFETALLSRTTLASNSWVDARLNGGLWSRELFPCGCSLVLIAPLVLAVYRRIAMRSAVASVPLPADDAHVYESLLSKAAAFSSVAVAVDMLCGTVTKTFAESPAVASHVCKNEHLFVDMAYDVSETLNTVMHKNRSIRNEEEDMVFLGPVHKIPHDDADRIAAWAVGITCLRKTVAEKTRIAKQAWCFSRVTRCEWIHQAHRLAFVTGMYGRAEEIVAAAMKTRKNPAVRYNNSSLCPLPTEALVFEPPNGWPCDVAYSASLAAESLRVAPVDIGDVIPLADSVSVVVLPGRGCRCGNDVRAADGTDAYISGSMAHMMGSGVAYASDCSMLYPFALLTLWCSTAARIAQRKHETRNAAFDVDAGGWKKTHPFQTCAEPSITKRRDGWDSLLWAAVAYISDVCAWSLDPETREGSLASDVGKLIPEDELFCEYRLIGKLLIAANPGIDDALLKRGIVCIVRPKRRWNISAKTANDLLLLPEMADQLVAKLCDALKDVVARHKEVVAHRSGDDDTISLVNDNVDRDENVTINVSLVTFITTVTDAAPMTLRSLSLADEEDDSFRSHLTLGGTLLHYDVATLGSPAFPDVYGGRRPREETKFRFTTTTTSKKTPVDKTKQCTCDLTKEGEEEENNNTPTVPEILRLASEFVKCTAPLFDDAASTVEAECTDTFGDLKVVESAIKFVVDCEVAAKTDRRKAFKQRRCQMSQVPCSQHVKMLRDACVSGWNSFCTPLAVMACTGEMITSKEFLPVADHPMSNPLAYPSQCVGCRRNSLPRMHDLVTFSECLPYKHGPMMSEIVHAGPSGIRVCRHAHPREDVSSSSKDQQSEYEYPLAVVRHMIMHARKLQTKDEEEHCVTSKVIEQMRSAEQPDDHYFSYEQQSREVISSFACTASELAAFEREFAATSVSRPTTEQPEIDFLQEETIASGRN